MFPSCLNICVSVYHLKFLFVDSYVYSNSLPPLCEVFNPPLKSLIWRLAFEKLWYFNLVKLRQSWESLPSGSHRSNLTFLFKLGNSTLHMQMGPKHSTHLVQFFHKAKLFDETHILRWLGCLGLHAY